MWEETNSKVNRVGSNRGTVMNGLATMGKTAALSVYSLVDKYFHVQECTKVMHLWAILENSLHC